MKLFIFVFVIVTYLYFADSQSFSSNLFLKKIEKCKEAGYCRLKFGGEYAKKCGSFSEEISRRCLICRYFFCKFNTPVAYFRTAQVDFPDIDFEE
ncbi:unnamed protein product [Clavelina lepadiformis]|uniref:Uncharacterized protein n=1 Tax=Clavelina lepadiformis TaxID=159417 RepID=A0ABP0EWH3_CLALP